MTKVYFMVQRCHATLGWIPVKSGKAETLMGAIYCKNRHLAIAKYVCTQAGLEEKLRIKVITSGNR